MSTLVTALFYLWISITVLVLVLWLFWRGGRVPGVEFQAESDLPPGDPSGDAASGSTRPPPPRPPTIGELLDGVALPFGLMPSAGRIAEPHRHAVFLSTHPDPGDVGTAFADQLVDRGFAIEPAGLDEALAIRGADVLSLRITPEAASVKTGGRPRYPTAGAADVALEVWIGQGPPPALAD